MIRNLTINTLNSSKRVSLVAEIRSVQHNSNQRELFDYLLIQKPKDFDLKLEQLILIEVEIKIRIDLETEELVLKYQVVFARSYSYFIARSHNNFESYRKFITRLTPLSDLVNNENKIVYETTINLLEAQNEKVQTITTSEFYNIDANNILKFEYENCKFGLYICEYRYSFTRYLVERGEYSFENDKSGKIKKVVLSSEFPEYNTYIVTIGVSPKLDLSNKAWPSINEGYNSYMNHQRDFSNKRKCHGFKEGAYFEIYELFQNIDALRKVVSDYAKIQISKTIRPYSESIDKSIDWTNWNDDFDTDQQSDEFWNQF